MMMRFFKMSNGCGVYFEVKIALSMPYMVEHLILLANRTFVVRPRGGAGVSVALFRLEPWIRM